MKFQIQFMPVSYYGFVVGIGYAPGKSFNLTLQIWNRVLIVGWAVD